MKKQIEAEGGRFLIMGGISDSVDQAAVLPAFHFDTGNIPYPAKKSSEILSLHCERAWFFNNWGCFKDTDKMPLPIVREFHLYVSTIEDEINAGVAVENRTAYKPKRVAKKRAGSDNKSRGKKDAKVQQRELSTFDKDLRGGPRVSGEGNGEQEKPDDGRPDIGSSKPRGGTRVRQGDKRVQPEQRVSRLKPEETEEEKHRNRSEAMKGNQNAKKNGTVEEELQTPHILTG